MELTTDLMDNKITECDKYIQQYSHETLTNNTIEQILLIKDKLDFKEFIFKIFNSMSIGMFLRFHNYKNKYFNKMNLKDNFIQEYNKYFIETIKNILFKKNIWIHVSSPTKKYILSKNKIDTIYGFELSNSVEIFDHLKKYVSEYDIISPKNLDKSDTIQHIHKIYDYFYFIKEEPKKLEKIIINKTGFFVKKIKVKHYTRKCDPSMEEIENLIDPDMYYVIDDAYFDNTKYIFNITVLFDTIETVPRKIELVERNICEAFWTAYSILQRY